MALSFEQPNHPPFQASFTPEFAARLRDALHIHRELPHRGRWNGYELEIATHQDTLQYSMGWMAHCYQDTRRSVEEWCVDRGRS